MSSIRDEFGRRQDAAPPEPLPAPDDGDTALFRRADALNEQADRCMEQGEPTAALIFMDSAVAWLNKALGGRTDQPGRERFLGHLYGKQASVKVKLGDLDGAAKSLLDSWTTYRGLSDRYPIDYDLKADVAIALQKIARVLMMQGRHADALRFIQDASKIFAELAKEWNGEPKYRQFFAACTELLAECFTALGHPELAAQLKQDG